MTMPEPRADSLAALRARYLQAQLAGSRREAVRVAVDEALALGADVLDVELEIIQEAQREIGRLWQENAISVAQEHMATAISHMALARLYERAERKPGNGKKVLIACVEGEDHDFPARLVADALDLAGFEVRYLGADVPTESLLETVRAAPPDLLALSVTMTFNVPALRRTMARVRAEFGELKVAIGGGACAWMQELPSELGASATAGNARELVTAARELLGVAS